MRKALSTWLVVWSAACGAPTTPDPADDTDNLALPTGDSDADPCADYTWETVGEPFVLTWCAACHSAEVKGAQRQGAPASVHFDTEEEAVALAPELGFVAARDRPTMPPSGGPDADTRARFATWVACVSAR